MTDSTHGRVLFDEAHSEAWTIRPELALGDAAGTSRRRFVRARRRALTERDFAVQANIEDPLTAETLAAATCS